MDPVRDRASGLVGPLVVCRSDAADTLLNKDLHHIFFVGAMDETKSWYIDENINKFSKVNRSQIQINDADFVLNNTFHSKLTFLLLPR